MIIDACALVGAIPMRRAPVDFPQLREEMDRVGVSRAVVVGLRGMHADARKGNDYVFDMTADDPRLVPTAVIGPRAPMLDIPDLIEDAVRRGAAGLVFPVVSEMLSGALPVRRATDQAAATGLPLIACGAIQHGASTQLAEMTTGLGCKLLIAGANYYLIDELIAVLEEHPHVYVETSWQVLPGCIELLVDAGGADRVLFGSGAPVRPVRPALNMVLDADVDDAVKRRILAGNAMALFGLDGEVSEDEPLPSVEVPGTAAIDVHNHLGTMPGMSATVRDADGIEQLASEYGMEYSVCSSYVGYYDDLDAGNCEMIDVVTSRPRLLGSPVISPTHLKDSVRWLDMFDKTDRLAHATLMIDTVRELPGSEGYMALFAETAKRGIAIFLNGPNWDNVRLLGWPSGPARPPFESRSAARDLRDMLIEVDRRHPELAIIAGHGMGDDGIWLAQRTQSFYLEYSGTYPERGFLRQAIDKVGADRIVFGSDLDFIKPAYALGVYQAAQMTPEEERLIMAENARGILRLPKD